MNTGLKDIKNDHVIPRGDIIQGRNLKVEFRINWEQYCISLI